MPRVGVLRGIALYSIMHDKVQEENIISVDVLKI